MKRLILTGLSILFVSFLFGQKNPAISKLIDEGIEYHDRGNYRAAIEKYDEALKIDSLHFYALSEKALSLVFLKSYEDAIKICELIVKTYPEEEGLKTVYSTYAKAYNGLNKREKSIEIYDEALKKFPDYYQLYFNKGVTYLADEKSEEALLCFQKSVRYNPKHLSSHYAISTLINKNKYRIPALLSCGRFLVLEPKGKRAREVLMKLQNIMIGNVEKTGKNSITINVSSDMLDQTNQKGKPIENNFSTTDLILSMDAALDYDKKNKKKSEIEQFIRKFETVCSSLEETKKDNFGFYWEYYVPYYLEMHKNKLVETFAYIIFSSSDDESVSKWLNSHEKEIDKFYTWSNNFEWKKK